MTVLKGTKQWVERWAVWGDTDKEYIVAKKADGTFGCSCPAWKFHKAPKPDCKHIERIKEEISRPAVQPVASALRVAVPRAVPQVARPATSSDLPTMLSQLHFRKFRDEE